MVRSKLEILLDTVITMQMCAENLEELRGTDFNKQKIKMLIRSLLSEIDPILRKNYTKIYGIDQEATQNIISEYERYVKYLAPLSMPDKVMFCQMTEAWNIDKKTVEATLHRIINKRVKK